MENNSGRKNSIALLVGQHPQQSIYAKWVGGGLTLTASPSSPPLFDKGEEGEGGGENGLAAPLLLRLLPPQENDDGDANKEVTFNSGLLFSLLLFGVGRRRRGDERRGEEKKGGENGRLERFSTTTSTPDGIRRALRSAV